MRRKYPKIKFSFKALIFLPLFLIFLICGGIIYTSFFLPGVSELKYKNPEMTSFMKYRIKQSKGKMKVKKKWVKLSKISPYLIQAVIISEDDRFYSHSGFDIQGIKEAFIKNLKNGKFIRGGSTITQQVAKNLFLTPEKTLSRKIKEAIITWKLERSLTKERILEIYLNIVEWGYGIFGAEAASQFYFGKSCSELNPEEAARLASVLPNPLRYNPGGNSLFVRERSKYILNVMRKRNIISEDEYNSLNFKD